MRAIRVSVKNWAKYNPRTDRANHSWFRLENSIMTSEDLFGLKIEHKWVWVCLLCLASRKAGEFEVSLDWLATTANIPRKVVVEAIHELMVRPQISTIEIIDGNLATPSGNQTVSLLHTTNERTNDTIRNERTNAHLAMLDTAYQIYPLKKGKSKGLERAKREVKEHEGDMFISAIRRYRDHIEKEGIEPKFIKHFSTWVGEWRDWLDSDAGTSLVKSSKDMSDDEFFSGIRQGARA